QLFDEPAGPVLLLVGNADDLSFRHHRAYFCALDIQCAVLVSLLPQAAGNAVLKLDLLLQVGGAFQLIGRSAAPLKPCPDRAVRELCLIANQCPIEIARSDLAIISGYELNHDA